MPDVHPRVVIGVGNADRGDDAVGHRVARRIRENAPPGVAVMVHGGEATDLLERIADARMAIVIDAAAPLRGAGTIHRFDAVAGPLPASLFACSTHGFGVAEAIELARVLGRLPAHCLVFAIEGRGYAPGAPLAPEVAAAAETVAQRVLEEIERIGCGQDREDESGSVA